MSQADQIGLDRALVRIFVEDRGDLREGVLHRVRDDIAQFRLDDLHLREILDDVDELVVADRAGRHAVEAVEDDDIAFAADIGDELQGEVLADAPIVRRGVVDRVGGADIDGQNGNAGVAGLLQPGIDDAERAEDLDDRIRLLSDERLQLGDQLAVVAAGIDGDRLAAQALHLFDLGIVDLQIEIVVRARGADGDALALQREPLVIGPCAAGVRSAGWRLQRSRSATAASFKISRRPKAASKSFTHERYPLNFDSP